jgi:hypothetical protein
MEKLIVSKFKDGSVINKSKTEGVVFLRVVTEGKTELTDSGILLETKGRGTTMRMQQAMYDKYKAQLAEGADVNALLSSLGVAPKKIIKVETVTPQYEGHTAKINPTTKVVCLSAQGQPIYYNTKLADLDAVDVVIPTGVGAVATASAEII